MSLSYSQFESDDDTRRPLLIVISDVDTLADGIYSNLLQHFSVLHVGGLLHQSDKVVQQAEEVSEELSRRKVKRAGILGIGSGASIAQAIAVRTTRLVRHLILIDALTRMSPTLAERVTDVVEKRLPLGLPFRTMSCGYDSRSELHRIQCPTLLLRSQLQDPFLDTQFETISLRVPNCWKLKLRKPIRADAMCFSEELTNLLIDFFEIPVKSPQKM